MLNNELMRAILSQTDQEIPVDQEVLRRNIEKLQQNRGGWQQQLNAAGAAPPPAPVAIDHAAADERIAAEDARMLAMPSQFTAEENAPDPAAPAPEQEQGFWDKLLADPTRAGMLRYGLGVLGGEGAGTAMDAGMKLRPGPAEPYTLGAGQGRYGADNQLLNQRPFKPASSTSKKTDEQKNWEYMMQLPEGAQRDAFRTHLMKTGSGKGGTKAIKNYNFKESIKNDPNMSPEDKKAALQQFDQAMYADKWLNVGDKYINPRSMTPTGQPETIPKGIPPEQTLTHKGGVKQAEVAGVAAGEKALGIPQLSPAQEKVDEIFAKDYAETYLTGGVADAIKNLGQIEDVATLLEDISTEDYAGDLNLTGDVIGNTPDMLLGIFNPSALNAKDQVEEVVQRNLRVILGAQFTENEGKRLIARAYNPRLGEKENAVRLRRLVEAMRSALEMKQRAARYYEKHGTLKGFQGTLATIESLEQAIEGKGRRSTDAPEGVDQEVWDKMLPEDKAKFK